MHKSTSTVLPHGIDLRAPGGIERLLAFHRCTFGDAQMNANANAGDGGNGEGQGAGGNGGGQGDPAGGQGQGQQDQSGSGAGGQQDEDEEPLGEPGKRALQAERTANRQLKDDLAARDQRIRELEDKDKTEEQRRDDRLKELEQDATSKASDLAAKDLLILKYQVAASKGLDLTAAERLHGKDRDELLQDADDWIGKWGTGGAKQPVPDPGQGGRRQAAEDPWESGRARAQKRFGSESTN